MIKIYGLNWKKGSGDRFIFGYLGEGHGNGMFYRYFYSNSDGNGFGDGYNFGDKFGDGESWNPHSLKQDFKKYD